MRHCWGTTPAFQTDDPPMWRAFDGPEGKAAVPRFPRAAARPGNDPKHLATRQRTRQHPCGGRRRARAAGPGAGNTSGVTQPHPAAHAPPRRHRDAAVLTPVGHNKAAQPQWGRAAVAVALGFEPRVAVTPHSISSAAPSAARTRYLTRILYYRNPRATQIDPPWEQRHTQREPRSRRS